HAARTATRATQAATRKLGIPLPLAMANAPSPRTPPPSSYRETAWPRVHHLAGARRRASQRQAASATKLMRRAHETRIAPAVPPQPELLRVLLERNDDAKHSAASEEKIKIDFCRGRNRAEALILDIHLPLLTGSAQRSAADGAYETAPSRASAKWPMRAVIKLLTASPTKIDAIAPIVLRSWSEDRQHEDHRGARILACCKLGAHVGRIRRASLRSVHGFRRGRKGLHLVHPGRDRQISRHRGGDRQSRRPARLALSVEGKIRRQSLHPDPDRLAALLGDAGPRGRLQARQRHRQRRLCRAPVSRLDRRGQDRDQGRRRFGRRSRLDRREDGRSAARRRGPSIAARPRPSKLAGAPRLERCED